MRDRWVGRLARAGRTGEGEAQFVLLCAVSRAAVEREVMHDGLPRAGRQEEGKGRRGERGDARGKIEEAEEK